MYKNKYIKYKKKYLELKKQFGGSTEFDNFKNNPRYKNILLQLNRTSIPKVVIIPQIRSIFSSINDDKLLSELNSISLTEYIEHTKTNDNIYLIYKIFNRIKLTYDEASDINPAFMKLLNKLGIIQKSCTVDEFMTIDNPDKICNNPTLVRGSCSVPSFFNELDNENSNNDKIIELLNLIESKLPSGSTISIIVGATTESHSKPSNIKLYFGDGGFNINEVLSEIRTKTLQNQYEIKNYFPTNIKGTNKNVLDKIIQLTDQYKIEFINKMCGSCFRSMYYLVKNTTKNFEYEVSPEQGLSSIADTSEIRRCFKTVS